jgi:CheY-like chemotaxis protein
MWPVMGEPRRRALVVDDDVDTVAVIRDMLDALGYDTWPAADGAAALEQAAAITPDLVVLDVGLPVVDGVEVARRLRLGTAVPALIVAFTGWAPLDERGEVFDRVLTKPARFEDLRRLASS